MANLSEILQMSNSQILSNILYPIEYSYGYTEVPAGYPTFSIAYLIYSTSHYRLVLERNESTRSMKLPLELYGTDEQAAFGAWVLLEANIAPLQDAPVVDPTPRAMNRSRRLLSRNAHHTDIVS